MKKRFIASIGLLGFGLMLMLGAVAPASATEVPCTPAEAYDETIIDIEAVDLWYSWTGGPSDEHAFPGDDWQVDHGNHNGFDQTPGLLQRDKGNSGQSDWFYHEVVAETSHIEHHDEVVCDPEPTPTPTETITPTPDPTVDPEPTACAYVEGETLGCTGNEINYGLLVLGAGALALGATAMGTGRRVW